MAEYASRGVANAGLTTGIIGASGVGLSILSSLLNGGNCCNGSSDNMAVNRYEAAQSARIAELETEVKLRDANTYTDSKLGDLRDYIERKFDKVEHELCDQRVFNATTISTLSCVQGQVAQLLGLTQLKIPNTSVCPGWGDVTVSVTPAATGA